MLEFFLGFLELRDITRDAEGSHNLFTLVAHRQFGGDGPGNVPVGKSLFFDKAQQRFAGLQDARLVGISLAGVFEAEKIKVGLADGFAGIPQTEVIGQRPVDAFESALPILEVNAVRDVGLQSLKEAALLFQNRFNTFSLQAVANGAQSISLGIVFRESSRPLTVADYVVAAVGMGAALFFAYFPFWLGLALLVGRREVLLRDGKIHTTERLGLFWRTKRWPMATLKNLQIVGFIPTGKEGARPGSLLNRLDALTGLMEDGTRFMIVLAYPRQLLIPFAEELARRCDARFDGGSIDGCY